MAGSVPCALFLMFFLCPFVYCFFLINCDSCAGQIPLLRVAKHVTAYELDVNLFDEVSRRVEELYVATPLHCTVSVPPWTGEVELAHACSGCLV